nr:Uncharacterised protein [Raoultella sp. NCTC 9187]
MRWLRLFTPVTSLSMRLGCTGLPLFYNSTSLGENVFKLELFNHRTADDFVLNFFAQLDEVGAVARHADDQVAVFFRLLLRFFQHFVIDVAELHLTVAENRCGTQQRDQAMASFRRIQQPFEELEVVHHADVHGLHVSSC